MIRASIFAILMTAFTLTGCMSSDDPCRDPARKAKRDCGCTGLNCSQARSQGDNGHGGGGMSGGGPSGGSPGGGDPGGGDPGGGKP